MMTFAIIAVIFIFLTYGLIAGEALYYSRKMPNKSLIEIDKIIENCDAKLNTTSNIIVQKDILDTKEYWLKERQKLIDYHKRTGKIYEISRQ